MPEFEDNIIGELQNKFEGAKHPAVDAFLRKIINTPEFKKGYNSRMQKSSGMNRNAASVKKAKINANAKVQIMKMKQEVQTSLSKVLSSQPMADKAADYFEKAGEAQIRLAENRKIPLKELNKRISALTIKKSQADRLLGKFLRQNRFVMRKFKDGIDAVLKANAKAIIGTVAAVGTVGGGTALGISQSGGSKGSKSKNNKPKNTLGEV